MANETFLKIENGAPKPGSTFDPLNVPAADEKSALGGTNGTPGPTNKYVTDSDPRLLGAASNESNGPFRMVHYQAMPANSTLNLFDSQGLFDGIQMPSAGSIVRAVVRTNDPRTAGQADIKVTKNGLPLAGGLNMTLDAITPESDQKTIAPATAPYTFAAGDRIGAQIVTDVPWAPNFGVSTIVSVDFYVTFN